MISEIVGMIPDEVVCNMVDCHLYEEHVEPAKEWLNRYDDRFADNNEYSHEREELFTFCKSNVSIVSRDNIDKFKFEDFTLKNYVADKSIKAKLLT
jgi:thymidylate synthase